MSGWSEPASRGRAESVVSIYERLGDQRGIGAPVDDCCGRVGVQDRDNAAVGQALTANRDNIVTAQDPAA